MTYTAGSQIAKTDYNTFAADVNNLWGTGSGNKGYGQTTGLIPFVSLAVTGGGGIGYAGGSAYFYLTFASQTAAPFPVGSTIQITGVSPTNYIGTGTVTDCTTTTVYYTLAGGVATNTAPSGGWIGGGGSATAVTATQWSTLTSRVNSIRYHQTGGGVSFLNETAPYAGANITAGQRVYAVGNLATALSSANTAMTTAVRNTSTAATYDTSTAGVSTSKYIGANPTTPTSIYVGANITWGSYNQMRWWFNAGGFLDFSFSMTNAGTSKTQSWSNLCSDMGTIRLGGLASGPLGNSGGFTVFNGYTVMNIPENGTWNRWYLKYNDTGVADYNANYLDGYVYRNGATLNFLVYAYDNAGDTFYGYPTGVPLNPNYVDKADYVDYPLVYTVNRYGPSTAYGLTNTWGTPTVTFFTS